MDDKPAILVRRREPGLGDIICCSVAVRAAYERYGSMFQVHAVFGRQAWNDLFADQGICDQFLDAKLARIPRADLLNRYVQVFELDGIDERTHNTTKWVPMNRIEIWCKAVDHMPADLCPRWKPTDGEVEWAKSFLSKTVTDNPIILQWACSPTMRWKNYPHRMKLLRMLAAEYPVVVVTDRATAAESHDWDEVKKLASDSCLGNSPFRIATATDLSLRELGAILSQARLVVCPDSSILHFAAAVDVPCLGLFGGTSGEATCKHYPKAHWIQGPVEAGWRCAGTAPCAAMNIRNFWCHANPHERAECLAKISPDEILKKSPTNCT